MTGPYSSQDPLPARQASLLSRLVTVLGLAFFVVELVVLAVFTYWYWDSLRADRKDHLARYAAEAREYVRAELRRQGGRSDEGALDADLDAALQGKARPPSAERRRTFIPPTGAPVSVWLFAGEEAREFTRTGQLLPTSDSAWPRDYWPPEVREFLGDERLAPRIEVYADRIVQAEPLPSGGPSASEGRMVLYLETSLEDIQHQDAAFGLTAFATGALALLVTALVTIGYMRRKLLLPLAKIIQADNAARRGDQTRAVVDEGEIPDDEVGAIMRSRNHLFQAMIRAQADLDTKNVELEQQREDLRKWGRELERLVQDKTNALLRARDVLYRTEKLAALGRLAANVAHEINNPLASIAGYAEEAREELSDLEGTGAMIASLKVIEEQAFRCKDILKRLLGLARTDAIELTDIELPELVRETVALAESGARKRGVDIQVELPETVDSGGPLQIRSDRASLQQVVLNLVENAVDASVQGVGPPWVRVSLAPSGSDEIALVVQDSGRGIPAGIRERVFDPFYTTKPVGRGTGLGLAICQSLVERLGGRITCESSEGSGATFTVWLPTRDAQPPAPPDAAPGGKVVDGSDLVEAHLQSARGGADPDELL